MFKILQNCRLYKINKIIPYVKLRNLEKKTIVEWKKLKINLALYFSTRNFKSFYDPQVMISSWNLVKNRNILVMANLTNIWWEMFLLKKKLIFYGGGTSCICVYYVVVFFYPNGIWKNSKKCVY